MKIDHKYMKQILEALRDSEKSYMRSDVLMKQIGVDMKSESDKDSEKFVGHIRLLGDEACIESSAPNYGFMQTRNDSWHFNSSRYRLTNRGYEFLDALSKQSIFNKIKDLSLSVAIDAGKQLLIEGLKVGLVK